MHRAGIDCSDLEHPLVVTFSGSEVSAMREIPRHENEKRTTLDLALRMMAVILHGANVILRLLDHSG